MDREEIIKRLERIQMNAGLLAKEAATLREELSGGSDSSNLNPVLSLKAKEKLKEKRRKTQMGN